LNFAESVTEIVPQLVAGASFLADETCLKPVLQNDPLLFADWGGSDSDGETDAKQLTQAAPAKDQV
jgi:hypothetical protein